MTEFSSPFDADPASNQRLPDYWCFISYRHLDNRDEGRQWASWLHHALETFEVPGDLVGRANERGEVLPDRIFPVFRDEEELGTGNLTHRIYAALNRAKVLIVVCSPRVLSSKHVEDEIRHFKANRGEDSSRHSVHAAIIEGDPDSTAVESACFPEALMFEVRDGRVDRRVPVTPLAADFRLPDGSQGWTSPEAYRAWLKAHEAPSDATIDRRVAQYRAKLESGLLRLVAGVLAVPLAELTKRDKAYQLKKARVTGALKSTQLARALHDQDPLRALRSALEALDIIAADAPEALEDAYEQVAPALLSGRLARLGENIQRVHVTADRRALLVVHADGPVEILRAANLTSRASFPDVEEVSEPWGPDAAWRTLWGTGVNHLIDMRTGRQGLHPFPVVNRIVEPARQEYWKPLARYNHPRAECSAGLARCFVTSINDDDEWGAVDSFVEEVDLRLGTVSSSGDIYSFSANDPSEFPCAIGRGNGGWFIDTAGDTRRLPHPPERHVFSRSGRYIALSRGRVLEVFSCGSGDKLFEIARAHHTVVFSTDETHLLMQGRKHILLVSVASGEPVAAFANGGVTDVVAIDAPASWRLTRKRGPEIVICTNGELVRGVESVDPGGRVAKLSGGDFLIIATGERRAIPTIGCRFSPDPAATFFLTLHHDREDSTSEADVLDEIVFRRVDEPLDAIQSMARPSPGFGESSLSLQYSLRYVFVSSHEREDSIDPPFSSRYEQQTTVFDARTGTEIATVPFVLERHWCTDDRSGVTVLRGSREETNHHHAVIDNRSGRVVWTSPWVDSPIEALYAPKGPDPAAFVVAYAAAAATLHRVADGATIATLTGVVTQVSFSPDDLGYVVVWYKNGRCEIWRIDPTRAVRLAELGLIVTDVQYVSADRIIVQHADGRVYLTDLAWLSQLTRKSLSVPDVLHLLRERRSGPLRTPWWEVGHPNHHPWRMPGASRQRKSAARSG